MWPNSGISLGARSTQTQGTCLLWDAQPRLVRLVIFTIAVKGILFAAVSSRALGTQTCTSVARTVEMSNPKRNRIAVVRISKWVGKEAKESFEGKQKQLKRSTPMDGYLIYFSWREERETVAKMAI